ncbi:hypothetical protein POM88_032879 [Heracleum sosnowskyi]|uniref:Cyanobacterial aminoacyl-tRNA synthetase CAAD domain-containing protein n=1 Tax=Heracleum sosnowskyi TaxID=360622 RepID=A0AAD8I0H6_9APIA|nr:hypothetical protein POM88_032879 [Heracleum sosnowskyi]
MELQRPYHRYVLQNSNFTMISTIYPGSNASNAILAPVLKEDKLVAVGLFFSCAESKILDGYVKQLVESLKLDAIQEIKVMIIGDSKLVAALKPLVLKHLVEILVENNSESTKGLAACILGFENFMNAVLVLRTLTWLVYVSADYASFIVENGALEGALAVFERVFPFPKRIKKLGQVFGGRDSLTILDMMLKIRKSNVRYVWDAVENKSIVLLYGGGALVGVWLSATLVGAINSITLLPKIMELVGLRYTGWFVYRYLLFKSSRKELATDIESLKKKIAGNQVNVAS